MKHTALHRLDLRHSHVWGFSTCPPARLASNRVRPCEPYSPQLFQMAQPGQPLCIMAVDITLTLASGASALQPYHSACTLAVDRHRTHHASNCRAPIPSHPRPVHLPRLLYSNAGNYVNFFPLFPYAYYITMISIINIKITPPHARPGRTHRARHPGPRFGFLLSVALASRKSPAPPAPEGRSLGTMVLPCEQNGAPPPFFFPYLFFFFFSCGCAWLIAGRCYYTWVGSPGEADPPPSPPPI